jgi:putative copper export protein
MAVSTGEILALAGMGVLLLNNLARRRVKQGKPPAARGMARFAAYGDFVACGLILAGLVVIYLQK